MFILEFKMGVIMNKNLGYLLFSLVLIFNANFIYSSDISIIQNQFKYKDRFPNLANLTLDNAKEIINTKNDKGETILGIAAAWEDVGLVKKLVNLGADVNILDSNFTTPLIQAANYGRGDTVEYLLSQGADKTLVNNLGYTALSHALESQEKYKNDPVMSAQYQKVVRLLLADSKPDMSESKRGAEFQQCNLGNTQLSAICENLSQLTYSAKILLEKPRGSMNKVTINILLGNIGDLQNKILKFNKTKAIDDTTLKNYTDELNRLINRYNELNQKINGPSIPSPSEAANQGDIKRGVEFVSTPTPSTETQGNLRDQLRDLRDNDLLTYLQPKVLGLKEKLRGEKKGFDAVIDLLSKIDRLETFITYRLTSRIPLISIDTQKLAIEELKADYNDLLFTYTGEGNDPILNKLNLLKFIADNLKSRPKYTEFKTQVDQFSDGVDKLLSNSKNMKRNELEGQIGSLEMAQWHIYELFGKEFETSSK